MSDIVPVSKQLHDFVDDLERCLKYNFDEKIDCDNIVLCGMGGSAISGNVVADCVYLKARKFDRYVGILFEVFKKPYHPF